MRTSAAATAAALVLIAVPAAGASKPVHPNSPTGRGPLTVHAASLTQAGRDVVWSLDLNQSFSLSALGREHRSLCVLTERAQNGSVAGEVCLAAPTGRSGEPRLTYARVNRSGPGPPRTIAATISRPDSRRLTATFLPADINLPYESLRWQVISTLAPPACRPKIPDRIGCYVLFPARPALLRLHTPKLVGCVPRGPSFVNHGPTNRREVALTFDDGPWYQTSQFLDILEREHAVATFFEVGEHISTYGEHGAIERRMLADGDMIGDHTWSHIDVRGAGPAAAAQISMAAEAIRKATGGFTPCLFRAPGGDVSPALIAEVRSMGFTTIQWNVDPRDWALPGADAIYRNVIANARSGAIVIQHDGGGNRSQTLSALPREIETLRHEGYQLVTVTELLGQQLIYK